MAENVNETETEVVSKPVNPNAGRKAAQPAAPIPHAEEIAEARQTMEDVINTPDGYIEIHLSTRGKVSGAPEKFYIRNFSPEDLMKMGTASEADMPLKIVEILDGMIWNAPGTPEDKKITVKEFTLKEVVETLLDVYETFYTKIFPDQTWIPTDEDYEFLKQRYGGEDSEAYRERVRALENGSWKPKFDLDISKLSYYDVPDDFKSHVRVTRKFNGKDFTIKFRLPRYGDFVTLKFFIDEVYRKEDGRWAQVAEILKNRDDALEAMKRGENINWRSVPNVTDADRKGFEEYQNEKAQFAMTATKALYITEFDGQDVSQRPLEEKIGLARDPRVDYTSFQQAQKLFDSLKFGYVEEITVYDPIMEKVVTRNYTFQLNDLLQAISNPGDIEADISLE